MYDDMRFLKVGCLLVSRRRQGALHAANDALWAEGTAHWVQKRLAQARGALAVPQISVIYIGRMATSRRVTWPRGRATTTQLGARASVWRCPERRASGAKPT